MKLPLLIAVIAGCVWIGACSKDKYTTKPQLEFKLVNGSRFATNANVQFQFAVTDKEGDIQDTMWVQKISIICPDPNTETPVPYLVPDFTGTKNLKVQLNVNYTYGTLGGSYPPLSRAECASTTQRNDSLYFRFWLKDIAGNVSDTVTSPTITLLKD